MKELPWSVGRTVGLLALAAVAGGLAGAAVSFTVTPYSVDDAVPPSVATSTAPTATSTAAELPLVALESRPMIPLVPPGALTRRASPVAAIYRKPRGVTPEERTLTDERLLGQAVALTSDGWFVTATDVLGQLRIADLVVWHDKTSYAIERGFKDAMNGTAYLKVQSRELTTPPFGEVADLSPGSETWVEMRPRALSPSIVLSLSENMPVVDPVSSEISARRIRLHGTTARGSQGSPAWSPSGALMGIVESKEGEPVRIIPAASISSSFFSLLNESAITHAFLGVRTVDISAWRIDGDRDTLPARGGYLRDGKGKLAVTRESPAAIAGLKAGDVILAIERDILDGTRDLGEILSEYRSNTSVTLRVDRKGQELDIPVVLGSTITSEILK